MVCMFFAIQIHHHHLCSRTYYYYYLTLIIFFCSCDGVYFGLVFEQLGRPIASLHKLGQSTLEMVPNYHQIFYSIDSQGSRNVCFYLLKHRKWPFQFCCTNRMLSNECFWIWFSIFQNWSYDAKLANSLCMTSLKKLLRKKSDHDIPQLLHLQFQTLHF